MTSAARIRASAGHLAGALLALAELAAHDCDPHDLGEGYGWALATVLRDEDRATESAPALARDRLHRTADALPRPAGEQLPLADMAGPAVLAAANILLLHNVLPVDRVQAVVQTADRNMIAAMQGLFAIRNALSQAGYDM